MLEESFTLIHPVHCYFHKKQLATHLCSDLRCHNNPILCQQCFFENTHHNLHGSHELSIQPLNDSIEKISATIRSQSKQVQKIYNYTIKDNELISKYMEKGEIIYEQLETRMKSLKTQIQLELDLLIKDFQKIILLKKQEIFKNLDQYQKIYLENMDYIKANCQQIIQFNKGLKYYGNFNNLYLKLAHQTKKKSLQWFIHNKKILNNTIKILDNNHYIADINKNLQIIGNFDKLPTWIGQQIHDDKLKDIGLLIHKIIQGWIKIPQMKSIQKNSPDKYIPYYAYR